MKYIKCFENFNKVLLGYHASNRKMIDGMYNGIILDEDNYSDVIRNCYLEIISDNDEILENNDIEAMNNVFIEKGYKFTYVSEDIIEASSFQPGKYKYGDYLYKVYGQGDEILLDDPNEIKATIVVSQHPLYFQYLPE